MAPLPEPRLPRTQLPGPERLTRPVSRPRAPRTVFPERPYQAARWHWAMCYVLFCALLYACYGAFWLWYNAIVGLVAALRRAKMLDDEWVPVVYQTGNILVVFVLFGVAVWAESHLRTSLASTYYRQRGYALRLAWRFLHAALVLLALAGAAITLHEWTIRTLVL